MGGMGAVFAAIDEMSDEMFDDDACVSFTVSGPDAGGTFAVLGSISSSGVRFVSGAASSSCGVVIAVTLGGGQALGPLDACSGSGTRIPYGVVTSPLPIMRQALHLSRQKHHRAHDRQVRRMAHSDGVERTQGVALRVQGASL